MHPVGIARPTRGVWVKHKNALPNFGTHLDQLGACARFLFLPEVVTTDLGSGLNYSSQGPTIKGLRASRCAERTKDRSLVGTRPLRICTQRALDENHRLLPRLPARPAGLDLILC